MVVKVVLIGCDEGAMIEAFEGAILTGTGSPGGGCKVEVEGVVKRKLGIGRPGGGARVRGVAGCEEEESPGNSCGFTTGVSASRARSASSKAPKAARRNSARAAASKRASADCEVELDEAGAKVSAIASKRAKAERSAMFEFEVEVLFFFGFFEVAKFA